jgi:hypothetical protein
MLTLACCYNVGIVRAFVNMDVAQAHRSPTMEGVS